MVKIFCFGSDYDQDSLAWQLADELKIENIEFQKCERVEDLLNAKGLIYLMDVVKGIDKITIIDNLEKLEQNKIVSLHDFDAGFFIQLLNGLRGVQAKIIGIPYGSKKEDIIDELKTKLEELKNP